MIWVAFYSKFVSFLKVKCISACHRPFCFTLEMFWNTSTYGLFVCCSPDHTIVPIVFRSSVGHHCDIIAYITGKLTPCGLEWHGFTVKGNSKEYWPTDHARTLTCEIYSTSLPEKSTFLEFWIVHHLDLYIWYILNFFVSRWIIHSSPIHQLVHRQFKLEYLQPNP